MSNVARDSFVFSVVVPVYNLERYIANAIDSVLNQTIGFEENIQLILVDDGSSDGSRYICEEYANRYCENIIFLNQENAGVSAARNNGLSFVRGTYVNFLDGDDLWDVDAFESVLSFFELHPEVDVVACRQHYFEASDRYHRLDYKFKEGDRVVDVREEPDCIQMSVTSSFIRLDVLRDLSFDERLSNGEDAKLLSQIILDNPRYGVMRSVEHRFRRRSDGSSVTQNRGADAACLSTTTECYYQWMVDYSNEKFGYLIPYVQFSLINGLKYRVMKPLPPVFDADGASRFVGRTIELLRQLDDEVIIHARNASASLKAYMLRLKYDKPMEELVVARDGWVRIRKGVGGAEKSKRFSKLTGKNVVRIDECAAPSRALQIEGTVRVPLFAEFCSYVEVGSQRIDIPLTDLPTEENVSILGECYAKTVPFSLQIPAALKAQEIRFFASYGNCVVPLTVAFPEKMVGILESGRFVKFDSVKLQLSGDVLSLKRSLI